MKKSTKELVIVLIMIIVFIALLFIAAIFLPSCSINKGGQKEIDDVKDESTSLFTVVEYNSTLDCFIVYMNANKVMYAVSQGGFHSEGSGVFTLLVNPDGSPMIYDEFKIK